MKTYTLPASWASYLINNDASGFTTEEKTEIDKFLSDNQLTKKKVSCSDEIYFNWSGNVLDYFFL